MLKLFRNLFFYRHCLLFSSHPKTLKGFSVLRLSLLGGSCTSYSIAIALESLLNVWSSCFVFFLGGGCVCFPLRHLSLRWELRESCPFLSLCSLHTTDLMLHPPQMSYCSSLLGSLRTRCADSFGHKAAREAEC